MNVRYRVELSQSERDELRALVSGGKLPVRRLKRIQILLALSSAMRASVSSVTRTESRIESAAIIKSPPWNRLAQRQRCRPPLALAPILVCASSMHPSDRVVRDAPVSRLAEDSK